MKVSDEMVERARGAVAEFRRCCEEQAAPMELIATLEACRDEGLKVEIDPQQLIDLFTNHQDASAGWMPIETAPLDCGPVLVCVGSVIAIEYREDGCWLEHDEHYQHYMVVGGANACGPGVTCVGPEEAAPYTHWMPIAAHPSPPKGDAS